MSEILHEQFEIENNVLVKYHEKDGITDVIIPEGVTTIDNLAFKGCTNLINITIPKSVAEIGVSSFEGCTNLISVTIPNSVTTIKEKAFYNSNNIKTINIFSYKVFSLLDNTLKVIALNTIIKNKTKFNAEDVNKFGQYIVENKIEILKIIVQSNHLMDLLKFLLNDIYTLYTKEEINKILNETISKEQNNPEITTMLLNYTNNYQTNIKSIIDNEFDLGDFDDETSKGNTK